MPDFGENQDDLGRIPEVRPAETASSCPRCGGQLSGDRLSCPRCGVAAAVVPPVKSNTEAVEGGASGRHWSIWRAVLISNSIGCIIMAATYYLVRHFGAFDVEGHYIISETILVPLIIGGVAGLLWRVSALSAFEVWGYTTLSTLIGVALAAIFLHEGIICIMMVFPLVVVVEVIGAFLGRAVKRTDWRVRVTIAPLLICFFLHDAYAPHNYQSNVTDVVTIDASPAEVWPHLASFTPIGEAPTFWMFKTGLPMPLQSVAAAPVAGSPRACVFNHNAVFSERISEAAPGRRLAFIMLHQPDNPEIFNHATIEEGEFDLRGNADGTTTLIGVTRYNLHAFPGAYFDLWARMIGRNVHLRVMDHIKRECEQGSRR